MNLQCGFLINPSNPHHGPAFMTWIAETSDLQLALRNWITSWRSALAAESWASKVQVSPQSVPSSRVLTAQ